MSLFLRLNSTFSYWCCVSMLWVSFCFIRFISDKALQEIFSLALSDSFVFLVMTRWCEESETHIKAVAVLGGWLGNSQEPRASFSEKRPPHFCSEFSSAKIIYHIVVHLHWPTYPQKYNFDDFLLMMSQLQKHTEHFTFLTHHFALLYPLVAVKKPRMVPV